MDWICICLYTLYFFGCSIYSILAPFYPLEAKARGMTEDQIGLLFSMYALIACMFSPVSGLLMQRFGRKNLVLCGAFLLNAGVILFSFVVYLEDSAFVYVSYFARILMGMGGATCLVTCFAVLSNLYSDDVDVKLGIMETIGSIGLIMGPVIGGVIYNLLGYSAVFWIFSVCSLSVAVVAFKVIPRDNEVEDQNTQRKMSVMELLTTKSVIFSLIVVIFGMAGPGYIEPVLAQYLVDIGISKNFLGLAFAMPMIGYAIATKVQSMLPDVNKGLMLTIGLFVEAIAFFTMGYSGSTYFSTFVLLLGLIMLGLGSAWAYLPSLPYMTQCVTDRNKDIDKAALGDTLSTMMGTFHYVGEAIGPASAGVLTKNYGYSTGVYYFGAAIIIYGFIFAFLSGAAISLVKCQFGTQLTDPRHIELEESKGKQFDEVKVSEEEPIDSFEI